MARNTHQQECRTTTHAGASQAIAAKAKREVRLLRHRYEPALAFFEFVLAFTTLFSPNIRCSISAGRQALARCLAIASGLGEAVIKPHATCLGSVDWEIAYLLSHQCVRKHARRHFIQIGGDGDVFARRHSNALQGSIVAV